MRTAKINYSKIDKSAIYEGRNGKYIDLVFFENRDGEDRFGNLGFICQDLARNAAWPGRKGRSLATGRKQAGANRQATPRRQARILMMILHGDFPLAMIRRKR